MSQYSLDQIFLLFFLYSAAGWICETIYCSIPAKKFINRGFLIGPYCPIYGVGALAVLWATLPFIQQPLLVFLICLVTPTVIEYITGWLMESIFKMRWWDYSKQKFQLHGRICLKNSILFCLMGILLTYGIHPLADRVIFLVDIQTGRILSGILILAIVLDVVFTLKSFMKLRSLLERTHKFFDDLRHYNVVFNWYDKKMKDINLVKFKEILNREKKNETANQLLEHLESILEKKKEEFRLSKAFPGLKPIGLEKAMEALRENWKNRRKK